MSCTMQGEMRKGERLIINVHCEEHHALLVLVMY
jgi:hypothetical protein